MVSTYPRGFVEALTIREEDWERAMDEVCREHPLRELTLDLGPLAVARGRGYRAY